MSTLAEDQADVAAELAPVSQGGDGVQVTITRAGDGEGTRNDDTGVYTPPAPITQIGSGIYDTFRSHEIDGTRILATDIKFLLSPLALDGQQMTAAVVGATLTDEGGTAYRIGNAEPLKPSGVVMMLTLALRA